jgi:hypothetical protein
MFFFCIILFLFSLYFSVLLHSLCFCWFLFVFIFLYSTYLFKIYFVFHFIWFPDPLVLFLPLLLLNVRLFVSFFIFFGSVCTLCLFFIFIVFDLMSFYLEPLLPSSLSIGLLTVALFICFMSLPFYIILFLFL